MNAELVTDNQARYLESLSNKQLGRLWDRIYNRYTAGGGYQPFGYDWTTLAAVAPHFYNVAMKMRCIVRERKALAV